MRSIAKAHQPQELIGWRAANAAAPQNLVYGDGGFPSEAVRRSLLQEQYHLCAYTLRRLKTAAECEENGVDTRSSCHIEHILPQCLKVPGADVDYQNMVACYPSSQSRVACEFGAHVKRSFDPRTGGFVSPLSPVADSHFKFDDRGGVQGETAVGVSTIAILKLDHPTLVNDRAAFIQGYLRPKGKKLTAHAARRLAQEIMGADANGRMPAYCVAIAQAAIRHAIREERRAARVR